MSAWDKILSEKYEYQKNRSNRTVFRTYHFRAWLTCQIFSGDYQEIFGSPLAGVCSSLGYNSVQDLITEHPRELRLVNGIVSATLKEKTSQIQKLVNEQQRKKTKSRVSANLSKGFDRLIFFFFLNFKGGRQITRPRPMSAALPRRTYNQRYSPPPQRFDPWNFPPGFEPRYVPPRFEHRNLPPRLEPIRAPSPLMSRNVESAGNNARVSYGFIIR